MAVQSREDGRSRQAAQRRRGLAGADLITGEIEAAQKIRAPVGPTL